jgi:hypothetical protein
MRSIHSENNLPSPAYTSPSLSLLTNSQHPARRVKMTDSCRHLYKLITQRANRLYAGRGARRGPALVRSGGEATTTTTPQPYSTGRPTSRARHTVHFTSHTATRSISSHPTSSHLISRREVAMATEGDPRSPVELRRHVEVIVKTLLRLSSSRPSDPSLNFAAMSNNVMRWINRPVHKLTSTNRQ